MARSCRATFASRRRFLVILASQYRRRVLGRVRPLRHLSCPCQKQPWTKTTNFAAGKYTSGCPGRFSAWRRKRNPNALRPAPSACSGAVFRRRTACMIARRLLLENTSVMGEVFSLEAIDTKSYHYSSSGAAPSCQQNFRVLWCRVQGDSNGQDTSEVQGCSAHC